MFRFAIALLVASRAYAEDSYRISIDASVHGLKIFKAVDLSSSRSEPSVYYPSQKRDALWSMLINPKYPWHNQIQTTVFWCGEMATRNSPSNMRSAYDSLWFKHFLSETPFYAAVPYSDIDSMGHTKPSAASVPWYRKAFQADGISIMKDRWIEIQSGRRQAFAQIKDVGPYHVDDLDYVFRNQRPQPHETNNAALDVSPAVQEYLGLKGLDVCSWRFVDRPNSGPWTNSVSNNSVSFISR
jgi:hypothetical protein